MFLSETKKLPLLLNRGQACDALGVSRDYLAELIAQKDITLSRNKITLGSVARYLCE